LNFMNKMLFAAAFGAALIGSQSAASPAQPPAQAGQAPAGGRMQAERTRQQAQQMADSMFQRFDLNGDGVLGRDEAQQALAQAAAARGDDVNDAGSGRTQRMLERMFGQAQSVTLAQFEAQALARFDRQDVNRDGIVSAAERQQGWAKRAQ
jgi:Skp family chaperone for outer membrane proteins